MLRDGEGVRVGVLGDSGRGKSWLQKWAVSHVFSAGPVLVLDDKGARALYNGHEVSDLADLARRPPVGRVVVFRGDVRAGVRVSPDTLAAYAVRLSLRRPPVRSCLVLDELARAVSYPGVWRDPMGPLTRVFEEGRALGVSCLWGTQSGASVPREAWEQSGWLCIFRTAGRGLAYLGRVCGLDGPAMRALPGLGVGEWILYRRGVSSWDGVVYRV